MSFFSDLLKGVDSRLGINSEDPDRQDANVDMSLKFSTSTSNGVSTFK